MSKYLDLPIGSKYGLLTILERAPDRTLPSGRHRGQYRCLCDCGNEAVVDAAYLKSGTTKSCGCLLTAPKESRSLVGQTFGKLTVLERAEDHISPNGKRRHAWRCRCVCGKETVVDDGNLTSGHTKSCGHCQVEGDYTIIPGQPSNFIDLTGRRFGMLEVLKRGPDQVTARGIKRVRWWTKCSCGNPDLFLADGTRLRNGHVASCGCLRHRGTPKDLVGQTINGWKVLALDEIKTAPSGKRIKWWKCQDEAGNVITLPAYILSAGTGTPSPGRRKHNWYEFCDDYVICHTPDELTFTIDAADYDEIKDHYWFIDKHNGYVETRIKRKRLLLHRLIMKAEEGSIIDHINHDKTDNRKVNLRVVTAMQNAINRKLRVNNTSGYPGVLNRTDQRGKPWHASITVDKHVIHLGTYDTFDEAVAARKAAERKYFGEYSYAQSIASVPAVSVTNPGLVVSEPGQPPAPAPPPAVSAPTTSNPTPPAPSTLAVPVPVP